MRKTFYSAKASLGVQRLARDAATDWCSLVEQIAELEDILTECGAVQDQDADAARACLRQLLLDKRRQLRTVDVAVPATVG